MEKPFFDFEVYTPIVTILSQNLSDVFEDLYDYNIYPIAHITDKRNPVFKAIVDNRDKGFSPITSVIIPIRYLTQYLA